MIHKLFSRYIAIDTSFAISRIYGIALFALLGLSIHRGTAGAAPVRTPRDVFIFAGQSNIEGADAMIPDPPGFVPTQADHRTLYTGRQLAKGAVAEDYCPWGELKGHHRTSQQGAVQFVQGPEVGFARRLDEAGVRDIAIVAVWANFPRSVKNWPWAEDGELNRAWIAFVDARLQELRERGFEPRIRGFVWHQGIDDAIHGRLADHYEENLTALIAFLRRRYHVEDAPFVLARSVNSPVARRISGSGPDSPMSRVRGAQVAVAEKVAKAAWINVDDLPNVAQHHFSAENQLVIGRRFADAFLKLAGK